MRIDTLLCECYFNKKYKIWVLIVANKHHQKLRRRLSNMFTTTTLINSLQEVLWNDSLIKTWICRLNFLRRLWTIKWGKRNLLSSTKTKRTLRMWIWRTCFSHKRLQWVITRIMIMIRHFTGNKVKVVRRRERLRISWMLFERKILIKIIYFCFFVVYHTSGFAL